MRNGRWVLALIASCGLATPAFAQKTLSSYGSINPNNIVNKPVDLSGAAPIVGAQPQRPFGLPNFFSRLSIPGLPQRIAVSPLPPPGTYPSTQYKNMIPTGPVKK